MTATQATGGFTPMRTTGTHNFIQRTYNESGVYQWARETLVNAFEAGATRVEYGIEWQAVASLGVYRRTISDNGRGMTADELREFFNTFGGGGKPIGGIHENFGVGSKTSLLPWNPYGVVVVSWVDGEASMIWVRQDPETEEYGLRVFDSVNPETGSTEKTEAVVPFTDPEHGCDWAAVKPDWIEEHGTVIVLLGAGPDADTVEGDPARPENDIKGIPAYLNRRVWDLPEDQEVYVHELRNVECDKWPRSKAEAFGPAAKTGPDRRINKRRVRGSRHYIEYSMPASASGALAASGTVAVSGGTEIDWYLWRGDRPAVHSYANIGGFIASLYKNELYDVTSHHSTYRSFGVSEAAVRRNLWLIVRPPVYDDASRLGVYPRTDRNALLIKGGPEAGNALPIADWAGEFADNMPDELRQAIRESRGGGEGSVNDPAWRDRLADRFGARWKIERLRAAPGGAATVDAAQAGSTPRPAIQAAPRRSRQGGGSGGTGGTNNTGRAEGPAPAARTNVAGGIPTYKLVKAEDIEAGMLAAWQANHPDHPEGVVLINKEHPIFEQEIAHWQGQFADHHAEEVRDIVLRTYGEIAVAKVAHSEFMKGHISTTVVEQQLRSDAALTMALLGLISEEAVLTTRLSARLGRRRPQVA